MNRNHIYSQPVHNICRRKNLLMPDKKKHKAIPSNMESMPAASLVTVHTGSMCCFTLSSSFFTNIASLITNVKIKQTNQTNWKDHINPLEYIKLPASIFPFFIHVIHKQYFFLIKKRRVVRINKTDHQKIYTLNTLFKQGISQEYSP